MKTDRQIRGKLVALQSMLRERSKCEALLAALSDRQKALRHRIKTLDAALALQGDPAADKYFSALEGWPENRPAIAGRIGVG